MKHFQLAITFVATLRLVAALVFWRQFDGYRMTSDGQSFSPESTVTSLLARSGHLRSSLQRPDLSLSVRYGDREYGSATAALDAYIADFDRSMLTSDTSTGRGVLQGNFSSPTLPRISVRNKDVLQEQLTDRELDFLNLPAAHRPRRGPDRLSLTTDDLLVLPCDGSLPVTRTSAFLSQSRSYPLGQEHSYSRSSAESRPIYSHRKPCLHHPAPLRTGGGAGRPLRQDPPGGNPSLYQTPDLSERDLPPHDASAHSYPRWLTSQKSEMDFSGITSVPDQKYPVWLQDCGIQTNTSGTKSSRKRQHGREQTVPPSPRRPSWLGELEASYEELQKNNDRHLEAVSDSNDQLEAKTLRELRLELAERLVVDYDGSTDFDHLSSLRDNKIESLIRSLTSHHQTDVASPGGTEDILDADRSWDNPPITFKSPVPVGGAEDPGIAKDMSRDGKEEAVGSCSSGYSSRKHPGPVEALKQMLFSLQAVAQEVTLDQGPDSTTPLDTPMLDPTNIPDKPVLDDSTTLIPEDFDTAPGGQSLKRALHHLERLKSLVDSPGQKEKRTQEGKDS